MMAGMDFGTVDGRPARIWTISDGGAVVARVTDYGARLVSLLMPGRDGAVADVVLGHDRAEDYARETGTYFGATCGRYANRIAAGKFSLDGTDWQVERNEGDNHLHGGFTGFDRKIWTLVDAGPAAVSFATVSPDGEAGYPGSLAITARYAFTAPGRLEITMEASVDGRATVINLVNHSYFNLAGAGDITGHVMRMAADRYLPVDAALLPLGAPAPVEGPDFDFRTPRSIGTGREGGGHDHNFCLAPGADPAVEVQDPKSGRRLRLWTDQPGVQLYTGAGFRSGLTGHGGRPIPKFGGFTLETQVWPDAPNRWPRMCRLDPGEVYRNRMVLGLDVV